MSCRVRRVVVTNRRLDRRMSEHWEPDGKCWLCDQVLAPIWAIGIFLFPFFRWSTPDRKTDSWVLFGVFWTIVLGFVIAMIFTI